ncbi:D-Ala-D-Ala carboxypeptidase family metallohydrolase [uncultured Dokdonia sp.]|uniref:D-Ala-D-Ala carboxypeptidase family metallohydrolase n=1 Tax=uncultured Dokdonia sp. TaxID=575653 RepID=UPI002622EFB7|nr:D-Ala-D-Ala carboxypeptidase family metallohydrolase [uncultured Dokdonia sp.]
MISSYKHIYVGIGTVALIVGASVLVRYLAKSKTKKQKNKVDFSVFDSKDMAGSGKCIDRTLLRKLQLLEKRTGYRVLKNINSAVRSEFWNKKVGGVSDSAHLITKCKAVDIHAPTRAIRNLLVVQAYHLGFTRIGVGKTFVHLDVDTSKPQYVAWGYPSRTAPEINPFT